MQNKNEFKWELDVIIEEEEQRRQELLLENRTQLLKVLEENVVIDSTSGYIF